jgi:hypothetical protein
MAKEIIYFIIIMSFILVALFIAFWEYATLEDDRFDDKQNRHFSFNGFKSACGVGGYVIAVLIIWVLFMRLSGIITSL